MQFFTFVTLALCIALTFADGNDLPGCNQDIIDSISKYWDDNGTPGGVMAALTKNGKGTLLYSTEVVPVKVPVSDPQCVKGEFTKDTAKFTVVPSKGTLEAAKATVSYKVTETPGIVSEDSGKVVKYIIAHKKGVTAFYTCNPKGGDADADPAAGLAVANSKFKAAKKTIDSLLSDMNNLGFDLQTAYPKSCTK